MILTILLNILRKPVILLITALISVSCGNKSEENAELNSSNAEMDETSSAEVKTVAHTDEIIPESQQEAVVLKLPDPEVELPELPVDKKDFPKVQELDKMITKARQLEVVYEGVQKHYQDLEEIAESSLSGSTEEQIKTVLKIVNAFDEFDRISRPIGEMALEYFQQNFSDNNEFSSKYREAYFAAESSIEEGMQPSPEQREALSHLRNAYKTPPDCELNYLKEILQEATDLKENFIQHTISVSNTDLLVADYKSGKELTDLLLGTHNVISALKQMDSEHKDIEYMLAKIEEKKESRMEEIKQARETYRFPKRSSKAPGNASSLESTMKSMLQKNGYDVKKINTASEWIAVYSAFGVLMYYQIDFYVAAKFAGAESGVLDVLYVTGKTGAPNKSGFSTYSVGGIAEMLERNL